MCRGPLRRFTEAFLRAGEARHLAQGANIRVLMVDSEVTWRGGEAQVALLMRGLVEEGVRVVLAAPPGSSIEGKAEELGIEVLALQIAGGMDARAAWMLGRYLREGRFDIVHCHCRTPTGSRGSRSPLVATAGRRSCRSQSSWSVAAWTSPLGKTF